MEKFSKPKVILLIETSRAYGRALLRGITKYSRLHGPWVFYSEPGGLEKAMPHLEGWGANGIIMRDSLKGEKVIKMRVPVIVTVHLKEQISGFPFIDTDGVKIGEMAAEHFLNRGLQQFGFCGYNELHWSRARCQNFARKIAEAGFDTNIYKPKVTKRRRFVEKEQLLMAEWLKSLPKPVGVMAANDDRGRQLTEVCKIVGLRVPEEVAILGVDNDDLVCELSDPPLSSVALNVIRGGYEAAELLDRLMKGEKMRNQSIIIPPMHIEVRQSTDILAIEDKDIIDAVRFINENARHPIRVGEVADTVALSRRVLQQRFRRSLNRTVHDEIRRARMEQVARMLAETNLSVSEIASTLGYSGVEKISRYFRREIGMTPVAYRKHYGLK
jgi:LacI family transcriptional regulator